MARPAQARLSTRRSRMSALQAKAFQRPNTRRHSNVSRRPSRTPGSPADIRSRSQSNRCRRAANRRLGLGWFHGSPEGGSRRTSSSRAKPPASMALPAAGLAGLGSRGAMAKPSVRGRSSSQRCGGDPCHCRRQRRRDATPTAVASRAIRDPTRAKPARAGAAKTGATEGAAAEGGAAIAPSALKRPSGRGCFRHSARARRGKPRSRPPARWRPPRRRAAPSGASPRHRPPV